MKIDYIDSRKMRNGISNGERKLKELNIVTQADEISEVGPQNGSVR